MSAKERGARILWRETSAVHFGGDSGYYKSEVHKELQDEGMATCVPYSLINRTASFNVFNGNVTPLVKSWGIHVLEIWEATFLMPEWCHVGRGVDCAHFLLPGGTSYGTEALLKYIEEEM